MIAKIIIPAAALAAGVLICHGTMAQGFVYPAQGQTPEQQVQDEAECNAWATQQTGFDPITASGPQVVGAGPSAGGQVVGGAATGAALGTIGGLIGGNTGRGAAIGAGVGAAGGLFNSIGQDRQRERTQQQVNAQHDAARQQFFDARATCLRGRGYTVS